MDISLETHLRNHRNEDVVIAMPGMIIAGRGGLQTGDMIHLSNVTIWIGSGTVTYEDFIIDARSVCGWTEGTLTP